MSARRALYLGEDDLSGSGRYLAALLKNAGLAFDHRPDRAPIPKRWQTARRYGLLILSDYRYASFSPSARRWLIDEVHSGTGLLMIGGWASFTGLVGGYAQTDLETLLPVRCVLRDDRVNCSSGALLTPGKKLPTWLTGLQNSQPPVVCGYHRVTVKENATVALEFRDLKFRSSHPQLGAAHPALVLGRAGKGRSAAFLTDCAPHWAGGLIDWGSRRIRTRLNPKTLVETGHTYHFFFQKLFQFLATP